MLPDDLKNWRAQEEDPFQIIPPDLAAMLLIAAIVLASVFERWL